MDDRQNFEALKPVKSSYFDYFDVYDWRKAKILASHWLLLIHNVSTVYLIFPKSFCVSLLKARKSQK